MKIDNKVGSTPTSRVSQTTAKGKASAAGKTARRPSQDERVDIAPLSAQLQALESSLENVQVVDTARVEAIKQAISEGRFKVNADMVADRLLATVKELVLSHKG